MHVRIGNFIEREICCAAVEAGAIVPLHRVWIIGLPATCHGWHRISRWTAHFTTLQLGSMNKRANFWRHKQRRSGEDRLSAYATNCSPFGGGLMRPTWANNAQTSSRCAGREQHEGRKAVEELVDAFICGKSRRGAFQLQRKTRRDRMRAKLQEIKAELRQRMHQTIPDQGHWLKQVVTGHFAYYAVPK
jgi:hypothetical protein